jgi:hypothetical protein
MGESTMTPAQVELLVYDFTGDVDVAAEFAGILREFMAKLAYLMADHFEPPDRDAFVEDVLKAFES